MAGYTVKSVDEDAMEEHASNELASYKAALRGKIKDLSFYVNGTSSKVLDYEEIKALLEDNPTEK